MLQPSVTIQPDGTLQFIYSDELRPLLEEGRGSIKRVSHVEPTESGQWTADMGPVGGPVLGPFETRAAALEEEISWLRQNNY